MIPEPLHPAIVHFPIVLSIFMPLVALAALFYIRGGVDGRRAWRPVLLMSALLAVSAWTAVQPASGRKKDKVEDRVSKEAFEEHEESGERLMILSGVLLVVMAGGVPFRPPGAAVPAFWERVGRLCPGGRCLADRSQRRGIPQAWRGCSVRPAECRWRRGGRRWRRQRGW